MSVVPKKWALWSLLVAGGMLLQPQPACADVERYRPVPLGGGLVFILDTREGHAWTWQQSPPGNVSSSGESSRIIYQGNVRKNMKQPQKIKGSFHQTDISSSQRF